MSKKAARKQIVRAKKSTRAVGKKHGSKRRGTRAPTSAGGRAAKTTFSLQIFLSHKQKDRERASRLKAKLESHGSDRLEVFVSGEDIKAGEFWNAKLRRSLTECDLLVLLYTAPVDNMNWCLYEGGFFAGRHQLDTAHVRATPWGNRLICLHPDGLDLPDPLKTWQSLPANEANIRRFLREIYGSRPGFAGVNPALVDHEAMRDEFDRLVKDVIGVVGPPAVQDDFCFVHEMGVRLTHHEMAELKATLQMPLGVKLEVRPETLKEVFNIAGKQADLSWKDFVQSIQLPAQRAWVDHLALAIAQVNDRYARTPMLPLLGVAPPDPSGPPKVYRPIIIERSHLPDQWTRFRIALARAPEILSLREDGDRLMQLILIARNLTGTILPKSLRGLELAKSLGGEGHLRSALHEIWSEIEASRVEALNEGMQIQNDVLPLFGEQDHPLLESMMTAWKKRHIDLQGVFEQVRGPNARLTQDELRSTFEQTRSSLQAMRDLTQQLLHRLVARFAERAMTPAQDRQLAVPGITSAEAGPRQQRMA